MSKIQTDKNKCLLLNSDFTPIRILSWKQAMVIDFRHKDNPNTPIDVIDYHPSNFVNGANDKVYPIPSIIRIKKFFNLYQKPINFSRKNLFIRDDYSCQYCGRSFPNNQLTYDHVVPKSRYKPNLKKCTNWTNIVTSCRACNARKGNKTPQEAGMVLINDPYIPKYDAKYLSWGAELSSISTDDPCYILWKPYINPKHYERHIS